MKEAVVLNQAAHPAVKQAIADLSKQTVTLIII